MHLNLLRSAILPITLVSILACRPENTGSVDSGDTATPLLLQEHGYAQLEQALDNVAEGLEDPDARARLGLLRELRWSELALPRDLEIASSDGSLTLALPEGSQALHVQLPGQLTLKRGAKLMIPGTLLLEAEHVEIEEGAELLAEGDIIIKSESFEGGTLRAGPSARKVVAKLPTTAISITKLSSLASVISGTSAVKAGTMEISFEAIKDHLSPDHEAMELDPLGDEDPETDASASYEAAFEEADRYTSTDEDLVEYMSDTFEEIHRGDAGMSGEPGESGASGRDAECGWGGYDATDGKDGSDGEDGEDGDDGGNITVIVDTFGGGSFDVRGGDGGHGGSGGAGGDGGDAADCFWTNRDGGDGGAGGDGGDGGRGGDGGQVTVRYGERLADAYAGGDASGGDGGDRGHGGDGGSGGAAESRADEGTDGSDGANGRSGRDGSDGDISTRPG